MKEDGLREMQRMNGNLHLGKNHKVRLGHVEFEVPMWNLWLGK
jgi:hypothetical protein